MTERASQFPGNSRAALKQPSLQASLQGMSEVMPGLRAQAFAELDDYEAMTRRAAAVRDHTLSRLDRYLEQFEEQVVRSGGQVHYARDAREARELVGELCTAAGARVVTKSKSMVTEEIELNGALEARGMQVVETDLGEYIIQLRKERPSHILAPALHLSLEDVAQTFHEQHPHDRDAPLETPQELLLEAREVLRQQFLDADVGITGANFLVAETGGVFIVTNEGNADLTATLPDTHIVVTGIEKVVPTLDDATLMLRLLARSAIGRPLSNYTTLVHGPRQADELSGPQTFHVVLIDNGRSSMIGTDNQEMLRCIRCSACLNHCPVYSSVGGHAYGSVYPGPMGAALSPVFMGLAEARHLPNASTLCGRCEEVCPVRIPLPKLLRNWRTDEFARRLKPDDQRRGLAGWAWLNRKPERYQRWLPRLTKLARWFGRLTGPAGWLRRLPGFAGGFTRSRDLPAPAERSFQQRWNDDGERG